MTIERKISKLLLFSATKYPIVTLTGPRQSGKTTLCRQLFDSHTYVSLEPLDHRAYAVEDPRGFIAEYGEGAIIDEVQHAPDLPSYLQENVDARPEPGRFILTGSQHFGLSASVSQSLAGRTAVHHLLPASLDELQRFDNAPSGLFDTLWTGAYPAIFDRDIPSERWYDDYLATYVQRDVRQLLNVNDLHSFASFVRLCAGFSGQELNLAKLGEAAGVTQQTAKAWLGVLEASFLCVRLPAWHNNLKKQLVKAPKLHFLDAGLLCHQLGIRKADQLRHHPQRGAVFESWVVSEVYKARVHAGLPPDLFHFRATRGPEVDLVALRSGGATLVEAKSAATVASDFFDGLTKLSEQLDRAQAVHRAVERRLVYGGTAAQQRSGVSVIPWSAIQAEDWA